MARKKFPKVDPWNTCDCWQECQYSDECDGVCKGCGNILIPPSKEDLALRLLVLKEQKAQLEAKVKQINSEVKNIEDCIIQDMLTEEVDRFKVHDTFFYWRYDTFTNINKANKPAAIAWLQTNGYHDLVVTEIDKKELTKMVEGLLAKHDELPGGLDELVNVFEKSLIRTRRSAKKGA